MTKEQILKKAGNLDAEEAKIYGAWMISESIDRLAKAQEDLVKAKNKQVDMQSDIMEKMSPLMDMYAGMVAKMGPVIDAGMDMMKEEMDGEEWKNGRKDEDL